MKSLFAAAVMSCVILGGACGGEPLLKPVNLEKLNTAADEDDPFLGDNFTLFYASNAAGTWDILVSRRAAATQAFPAGKAVAGLDSKDADEKSPFLFLGKQQLFFFATNAIPDEKFRKLKNYDIKYKIGGQAPLILPGISEPDDELHPWVTADGRECYFSRKTKDGWQLFVARGPAPGPIGDPRPAGFAAGFHHATLSSSGLTMYLQGPLEKDRWGLFRARRAKIGGAWSKPEPLVNLNGPDGPRGDLSPCLSPDGVRLYFVSDRP